MALQQCTQSANVFARLKRVIVVRILARRQSCVLQFLKSLLIPCPHASPIITLDQEKRPIEEEAAGEQALPTVPQPARVWDPSHGTFDAPGRNALKLPSKALALYNPGTSTL